MLRWGDVTRLFYLATRSSQYPSRRRICDGHDPVPPRAFAASALRSSSASQAASQLASGGPSTLAMISPPPASGGSYLIAGSRNQFRKQGARPAGAGGNRSMRCPRPASSGRTRGIARPTRARSGKSSVRDDFGIEPAAKGAVSVSIVCHAPGGPRQRCPGSRPTTARHLVGRAGYQDVMTRRLSVFFAGCLASAVFCACGSSGGNTSGIDSGSSESGGNAQDAPGGPRRRRRRRIRQALRLKTRAAT